MQETYAKLWLKHQGLQESQFWKREEERFYLNQEVGLCRHLDRMAERVRVMVCQRVPTGLSDCGVRRMYQGDEGKGRRCKGLLLRQEEDCSRTTFGLKEIIQRRQ